MNDLSHFSRQAVLRDGTPVLVRAVQRDDRARLVAAFHKLDPQSVYTRFFSFKKELSAADLARLEATDFIHTVGLVATVSSGDDETIIGGGSYTLGAAADEARVAELAFTVEEDYQGRGLASALLALLAEIARDQGIARLEAEVLAANTAMLAVFQHSGLPLTKTQRDGAVHVVLDLTPAALEAGAR